MSSPTHIYVTKRKPEKKPKIEDEDEPEIEPILLQSSRGYVTIRQSQKKEASEVRASINSRDDKSDSLGLIARNSAPRFLPFVIHSSRARDHMIAWRDKLFMVPINMTHRFRSAEIEAFYCPFYLYSANVVTSRTVRVLEDFPSPMPCCTPIMREDKRSKRDLKNSEPVPFLTRDMIANLNPWPFQKGVTLDTAFIMNKSDAVMPPQEEINRIGMEVVCKRSEFPVHKMAAMSPEKVWETEVAPMLKEQLQSIDGEVLGFANVSHHVVFVPLYFARYMHEGKGYSFVLNGVNGVCWGQNPRGVSGLFHGLLKLFTGGRTATEANVGLLHGEDLNALDCTDVYDRDAEFFDLPSADQFLFKSAIGYGELENISEEPVELRAQWRCERKFAKTVTVYPHEKVEFSFAYKWCLQVMKGRSSQIKWNVLSTCGGGGMPDRFGMVSPTLGQPELTLSQLCEEGAKEEA